MSDKSEKDETALLGPGDDEKAGNGDMLTAQGTIPEAVQQAAEAQPEEHSVEVSSTGFVGRLVLESQTVRKLVPLRVKRDRTIRMRMPGERPPQDECYHIAEYNVIIRGRQMNHIGMIPDFQPMALWASTPEMKAAGEAWISDHWDLITIMRERGGRNKSTLIGSRGKTRRD